MKFDNLVIFVADSLRYDFSPDGLMDTGVKFKTVAQSTHSPPSFSTLSTGLYPYQHGVHGWTDKIPADIETVFDVETHETGYFQRGSPAQDPMYTILDVESSTPLSDLNEPFIYMERHDATHDPFGGTDVGSFSGYFRTRANDYEQIREEYKTGVEIACDRFQSILDTLAENNQLDNTLAVFTSDHGEQLGEADDVAHSSPITPELAYVPTHFINPSLQPAEFEMNPDESIIEHVDVIRTALEAAGIELGNHQPGSNLLNECRTDEFGLTTVKNRMGTFDIYSADSIWWREGGYEFCSNSRVLRLAFAVYRNFLGTESPATLLSREFVGNHISRVNEFGACQKTVDEANELLNEKLKGIEERDSSSFEISNRQRDRLKKLGYIE